MREITAADYDTAEHSGAKAPAYGASTTAAYYA